MNAISDAALSSMGLYGVPVLLLLSYLGSLGLPFPITMVIIAAGAMTREGLMDWRLALLACVVGAALADNSEYMLGHLAKTWLERRFGQRAAWKQGLKTIKCQGGWAILFTRFWLMPLAPAINLIAGSQYPYGRFLLFDLVGQLVWVLLYGGLGYFFASQWKTVNQAVGGFSWLSFGLLILAGGIFFLVRRGKMAKNEQGF